MYLKNGQPNTQAVFKQEHEYIIWYISISFKSVPSNSTL